MLVRGGVTGAGRKRRRQPAGDWRCKNDHPNRGYATRCLHDGCREKRA